MLSVIIPASNEAAWIARSLRAVLGSARLQGPAEVIVAANGCRDDTAAIARAMAPPQGWEIVVLEQEEASKPAALNAADRVARGQTRIYLDADCVVTPAVLPQLEHVLRAKKPLYASATPCIAPASSAITRNYARFWMRLPFNRSVAPGYGLFAVNAAGRARWGEFPGLISDDTFVRLRFEPWERRQVSALYEWPMSEGWRNLVRVRRRQNAGLAQLTALEPEARRREGKPAIGARELAQLVLRDPLGAASYAAITLAVALTPDRGGFARGR